MYNNCAWCNIPFDNVKPHYNGLFHYSSVWLEGMCICVDCADKFDNEKEMFAKGYIDARRK